MTNKTKSAIEEAADEHKKQFNSLVRGLIEEDDRAYECFIKGAEHVIEHPERYDLYTKEYLIKHVNEVANEAAKVAIEIERKYQNNRKPLGIQEARELVRQMLDEEVSFSRFVELINEGCTK